MRIPLEWLSEYVEIKKPADEIAKSFTLLGLMLDKPVQKHQEGSYTTQVLDLEHRMDRADWLSILGCARDYAAFEDLDLTMPKVHKENGLKPEPDQIVKIEVECPDLVNRFNTKVFRNIKVGDSPDWLKNRLSAYGIPSINNIVDITNYVMVEYGQPMHAQDLAKMEAQEIVIRRAKKGEQVTTLLGETIDLTPDQFVLTQAGKATVIGGIVGGNTAGVDETTTDIILDAGNYDQHNIRRTSRDLKILNETVLRYDKYLHPELAQHAMERATHLILELAGGDHYENFDWYPKEHKKSTIVFRTSRLEKVGGIEVEQDKIKNILSSLEYTILEEDQDILKLEIPYFRTDVVVEDDIVADILRINNYDNIPLKLIDKSPPKEITPAIYTFEEKLRDIMISIGLHEHITDPLIPADDVNPKQVVLENALTADKNALRTEIRTTLMPVVNMYQKYGHMNIKVFEIGKSYVLEGNKNKYSSYKEVRQLQVLQKDTKESPYHNAKQTKQLLAALMQNLGIDDYQMEKTNSGVSIKISGELIGGMDIFGFSLLTEVLLKHTRQPQRVRSELTNYTTHDLSLMMDLDQPFGPVYQDIRSFDENIVKVEVAEEYTGENLGSNKKAVLVTITFKTSQTEDIRTKLIKHLKSKHKVEYRG